MKLVIVAATIATVVGLSACTSSGNTERGALTGALLGGAAGAIIGNNTGSGDAGSGAAIGAAVGAAGGAVVGHEQDKNQTASVERGPNGEALVYDNRADRYYFVDRRSGRTYWANGDFRG
jgi:Glycine zipper